SVSDLARRLGKTPVQVGDRAGFIANALLLPYLNHALHLLATGYASRADIDLAATTGIGLPMGPLALLDLIGLDTALSIMEVLHGEFGGPRYTAAPLLRRLADAGRTGRKSGRGIYDYADTSADTTHASGNIAASAAPDTVTLIGSGDDAEADLATALATAGINVTRNPAHPTDLTLIAAAAGRPVLPAALATGRPDEAVGLHVAGGGLAEGVQTSMSSRQAVASAPALAARLRHTAGRAPGPPGLPVRRPPRTGLMRAGWARPTAPARQTSTLRCRLAAVPPGGRPSCWIRPGGPPYSPGWSPCTLPMEIRPSRRRRCWPSTLLPGSPSAP